MVKWLEKTGKYFIIAYMAFGTLFIIGKIIYHALLNLGLI